METPLIPDSPAWHAWRAGGIGSSDAPIIMGVSPWTTVHELWRIKTKRAPAVTENYAMRRGKALEAEARHAYEAETGHIVRPHFRRHPVLPWMLASLDGLDLDGQLVVEIKCPGDGDHGTAVLGSIPEKYIPQVQHQLAVTGASVLHYWSWDRRRGALVEVAPDAAYIARLIEAEETFWGYVQRDEAPPLGPADVVRRDDPKWREAAETFLRMDSRKREVEGLYEASRQALEDLLGEYTNRAVGAGVCVTRYTVAGAVDYKKVPALQGLDLEPYRKPARTQVRITREED